MSEPGSTKRGVPTRTRLAAALRVGLLVVAPTLVLCVGLLELGLRLQGRSPSNVTEGIFTPFGEAYRLKPDQTKLSRTPSYRCTIHTNALGLRDAAPGPRPLTHPYLAWLGDSATFGNGVDYEDSFVGRFGALASPRGLEVVNLAVGGHHLAEQEAVLQDFLARAPRPPERVVVVFTPQLLALFEQRHHDLFELNGYLYPRHGWLGAYLSITLGDASAAWVFFRDGVRRVQARLGASPRQAAAGILAIYDREAPQASPEVTRRLEARLARLDEAIRAAGAAPVHVYLPTTADLRSGELLRVSGLPAARFDLDRYRAALRRESEAAGVPLVDLTARLAAAQASGAGLGFMQDMHYNPTGHRVIAEGLGEALLGPPDPGQRGDAAGRRGEAARPPAPGTGGEGGLAAWTL